MTQGIRPDGQIFASHATDGEVEEFPATSRGWGVTIDGKDDSGNIVVDATNGIPPMEWDNGQRNKVDNNIWWLMQHAIPEWQASTWDTGAFVRYNDDVYYNAASTETTGEPGVSTDWKAVLSLNGAIDGRYLQVNNNLSEIAAKGADAQSSARSNLALGELATKDITAITQLIYPVGAVIFNNGTNPSSYLGFGTWTQRSGAIYGAGSITDADNNAQTFTAGTISGYFRAHRSHLYNDSISISVNGTTSNAGAHTHTLQTAGSDDGVSSPPAAADGRYDSSAALITTSSAGGHTHTVTSSGSFSLGSNSGNFLSPGYVVYMWERTA